MADIIATHGQRIVDEWIDAQRAAGRSRAGLVREPELREQAERFMGLFAAAVRHAPDGADGTSPAWNDVRGMLADLSRARARQGFTPSETATFVLSLKRPIFARLRAELAADAEQLADETWQATLLLDGLALYTTEVFLQGREEVIARQQQDMLELSTPVVQLWGSVLALPLIGTLDSARTQVVMENLLEKIVETSATIAIIDITGVPTVDTLVAQHLLKTVAAARLMGAECIISGIRPQIAQTIVHLGVDLADVVTKATLADAFTIALRRLGRTVSRLDGGA